MTSTVLITGASEGIGRATALEFANQGYNLVIAARSVEPLEALAEEISTRGNQVLAVPADVSDRAAVQSMIDRALATFGQIDVLINNAGICMNGPMVETSIEDWQKIINTNLWGYIYTIHALVPHFVNRKQGTIINVGSFGGKVPLPNMSAYCTSKYAITGLTETLRLELESSNVHVCAVHPSVTNTGFLKRTIFSGDKQSSGQLHEQMSKLLHSPLASQPEDVAKAIWQVVQHPQAEVVVGSAVVPTTLYRLFPGVSKWVMQQAT